MKYLFLIIICLFACYIQVFSQQTEEELLRRNFSITTNANTKYESDRSIYISIYLENFPDSIYRKYIDKITWEIEGLPKEATYSKYRKQIEWNKFYIYTGTFTIKLKISTPYVSKEIKITFEVEEEWKAYFIPGISYTAFFPVEQDKFGDFHGFSIEYLIFSGIHRNENKGPSHIKVYGKFDLMSSSKKDITEAFNYSLGINLSFERNPKRRYFIPFFGLDIGCLYQKAMGNVFCFTPIGGVWLYSDPNLMVHTNIGYLYPSESIETYRGFRFLAGLNFSLW